jgi:galactose mutarotase-like enzyme
VKSHSSNAVTFSLVDPDGAQGFPGTVNATASHILYYARLALTLRE